MRKLVAVATALVAALALTVPGAIGGPGQTPGVIVMAIDDRSGKDLDPRSEGLVVVFNASPATVSEAVPSLAGRAYELHPVQAGGGDPVVREAASDAASGTFTVPARTVAVFVAR